MQSKRSLLSIICTLAVIILCSVNTTYCWENLDQSALNITAGEATYVEPDEPDKPEEPEKPEEEPEEPEDALKPQEKPKEPQGTGSQSSGNSDTGDRSDFLLYVAVLLISFLVLMMLLGMCAMENRGKRKRTRKEK